MSENKKYKFCQSCGMPLAKDENSGGTEKDGSKSEKYCSYCYKNGEFVDGGISDVKEYQEHVIEIMKKNGMNGILVWILTRVIPGLERWKKKK